jgi:signal transduction histidine kinase
MIFHSIRWRLQAWHSLILVLVLLVLGLTAYHVAWDSQLRRADEELEQHLANTLFPPNRQPPWESRFPGNTNFTSNFDGPQPQPNGNDEFGPPSLGDEVEPPFESRQDWEQRCRRLFRQKLKTDLGLGTTTSIKTNTYYFALWNGDDPQASCSPGTPQPVPQPDEVRHWLELSTSTNSPGGPGRRPGPPHMSSSTRTRGKWRELYRPIPFGDCILIGRSLAPEMAAMHRLAVSLAVAGVSVLVLGLAGGWWLASRAIRPIEAISDTALRISGGDLSRRINAASADNELGRLISVLNSTFARLDAAFTHQARFTSDASHELRTPISVILFQTQTALSRERQAAEYREALEACQRAAQRMRKLTESLLDLARLDAGQTTLKRDRFDLASTAKDCLELIRPLAETRRIQLQAELSPTPSLGDPERIAQVITNLVSNAIHFNHEGGEVRVATTVSNGLATLSVTDTGPGIPAEDQPHIFERFYRVDKARTGIQGHTGLGLAICKAIVDAHNGSIEVRSLPGHGSTFMVKLPAA